MSELNDFKEEIKTYSTDDILLILSDQSDLYTQEEITLLKEELSVRNQSADGFDKEEYINQTLENASEEDYAAFDEARRKEEEELNKEEFERRKKLELMPVSTTDSIDGYKTSGSRVILSTTVIINTGYRSLGFVTENEKSKRDAIMELKQSALRKSCNAIVGLKFEFNHFVI